MNVYLDNAATTQPYPEVVKAMSTYLKDEYGNPGGNYPLGKTAKEAVAKARHIIADAIGCEDKDIIFTSGGSESDNLAIKGVCEMYGFGHIITTAIEHKAMLKTCEYLEKRGFDVTYLEPDERGIVTPRQVEEAIRPDTILVSVMMANNEIGVIEPIKDIAAVCHRHEDVLFHTDAVQAFGHIPIDVKDLGVDLMSVSGHKIHGPKGVGFLYCKKWIPIEPLIHGGSQEFKLRAGTENVPGIVGLGKAVEVINSRLEKNMAWETWLRESLLSTFLTEIPDVKLNGSLVSRVPGNINVMFKGVRAESLLQMLAQSGISCSTGSACNSEDSNPSHVLKAIGLSDEEAESSIRFSLSEFNTVEEIDYVCNAVKIIVDQLRLATGYKNVI